MTSAPDTQTLPTIVIIHDAWHTPTHYSKMIDLLSAQGFEVACPQLLSCSSEQNNTSSFNDDVNLLYPLIFDIASDGKDIICVLHGYGGYIGTEILGDLTATQRAQNGLPGGVVHIVWISAVMPDTGVSMQMAMGGEFPDYTSLQKDGTLTIVEPDRYLFNDLGAMEMVHWCEHLVRWSARASDIVCSTETPAYLVCPSTYIICSQDQLISETGQYYMTMMAQKKGAIVDEQLLESTGHDPMCSDPEAVVGIINNVVAALLEPGLGEDGDEDDPGNDGGEPAIAQTDGPSEETTIEATTPIATITATLPTSGTPPPAATTEPETTEPTAPPATVVVTTAPPPSTTPETVVVASTTPPPAESTAAETTPAAATTTIIEPAAEPEATTAIIEPAAEPEAATTIITTAPAETTPTPVTVVEAPSTPPEEPQPMRSTTIPLITPLVVSFGGITSIIPTPHSPTDELYAPQTPAPVVVETAPAPEAVPTEVSPAPPPASPSDELYAPQTPPPMVVVEPTPTVVAEPAPAPASTTTIVVASTPSPPPELTPATPSRAATVVIAPPTRASTIPPTTDAAEPTPAPASTTPIVVVSDPEPAPAAPSQVAPATTTPLPTAATINVTGDYYAPADGPAPATVYVSGDYITRAPATSPVGTNWSTKAQAGTGIVVVQEKGRCRRSWLRWKRRYTGHEYPELKSC